MLFDRQQKCGPNSCDFLNKVTNVFYIFSYIKTIQGKSISQFTKKITTHMLSVLTIY